MLKVMLSSLYIPSMPDVVAIIVRTTIIFLYTFLLLRFLGKKQVSQFTWFDILLIVALGSAVGDTMIYPERTIPVFIAMTAILVIVLLVKAFSYLMLHSNRLESVFEGSEELLVEGGRVIEENLKKCDLTERELMTLLREKGHLDLKKVNKVFLETDGNISVIKK